MTARILIVDDSALARRSSRRVLEAAGYPVIEAEDGMSALEQYFVHKPSLVILDLVMKGMYGLDVLARLREMDPQARVIVVSADVQHSSRELVESGELPKDWPRTRSERPVARLGRRCGHDRRAVRFKRVRCERRDRGHGRQHETYNTDLWPRGDTRHDARAKAEHQTR